MHSTFMVSTGVDSEAQLAHESSHYDNNSWVSMNAYPQSTMSGFGHTEFAYMPPITSHELPQDTLNRMPPPLQPRQSPQQKHAQEQQQAQQKSQQQQQPPLSLAQPTPHHHQLPQLPMLTVPSNPTWPSMLTNPSSYSAPPPSIHIAPRGGQQPPPPPPLKTKLNEREGKPNPRKMLTDDDRRRMCEYAESHPGVKQSEIGNIFGVERSTVSKVLRNKDKYISKEDRSKSPGNKKNKSKFPDIERALSNWVRNAQKTGVPVTDAEIKEKFRFFATSTGNPDTILKSNSTSWLEKFKQKNGIGSGRLVRRASETNIPDRRMDSMSGGVIGSPSLIPMEPTSTESPLSPAGGHPSASPLSGNRSDEDRDATSAGPNGVGHFMNFHADSNGTGASHGGHLNHTGLGSTMGMGIGIGNMGAYKHGNNQSTTSLSSVFTETPVSSFSGSALSPTVPFTFSPDSNVGSFLNTDPMAPPGSANFQRPRSQTLPALNLEYMNHPQNQHSHHDHNDTVVTAAGDSMTPKYQHHHHLSSTAPSSAVDSPMTDISAPSYGIDSTVVSPQLRRSSSSNSLFQSGSRSAGGLGGATVLGLSMSSGMPGSGGGSSPNSPTQDDARRAADTLLTFIQTMPSGFDQTDYMAVARLIDKLRLQATKSHGMGGLSRIPEGEGEMSNDAHHTKLEPTLAA